VIASFAGLKAYYGSHAQTAFAADPAPEVVVPETPTQTPSLTDTYLLPGIAGIIITIMIVGAVLAKQVRKRP